MSKSKKLNQKTVLIGLAIAVIVVIIGVFCFSYALEMLDLKADELGLKESPIYDPPFQDYNITGLGNKCGSLLVGVASTFLLFVVAYAAAKLLKVKRDDNA
jgi:hypothetical protein